MSDAPSAAPFRPQGQWLLLLAAAGIAIFLTWKMLQPFLSVLLWGAVLAILFAPLQRRLLETTRRPSLAASLSILVVLATVIVPLVLIVSAVAGEMTDAAGRVQKAVSPYLDESARGGRLLELQTWLKSRFHVDLTLSPERLSEWINAASKTLLRGTVLFVGGVLGGVIKLFLVLFTLYYFFRDGERLVKAIPNALPLSRPQAEALIARTSDIIHASINGSIVIAVVQGSLGGLTFALLGLPSALVWGVVMTVLALVPLVGPALVWGPAAIYLLATGSWGKALVLVVVGAGLIGTIDNFLRPRLVGKRARMHELTVFFTVLGGIQLFGMLGFLVGPVLFAVTLALIEVVRRGQNEDPPAEASTP